MGILHGIPLAFGPGFALLGLVGNTSCFALDHIADINFIYQHVRDSEILPQGAILPFWLLIPQPLTPFVLCWIGYSPIVEHSGNGSFAMPLGKQRKDFANHSSGFLINDEVAFLLRVLLIPVRGEGPNVEAIDPPVRKDAANILGHVLQIPLVYKPVDLAGLFISLVGCIRIVHNTDEPDTPDGKQTVDVLLHKFQLAGKPGLGLTEDDVKPVQFRVFQQPVKFRAAPVGTGVVIVAVNIVEFPPLFHGVLQQHGLLVLDAVAIVGLKLFVPVLLGQAAVNRYFHVHIPLEIGTSCFLFIIPHKKQDVIAFFHIGAVCFFLSG